MSDEPSPLHSLTPVPLSLSTIVRRHLLHHCHAPFHCPHHNHHNHHHHHTPPYKSKLPLPIEPSSGSSYEAVYDLYQNAIQPFAAAAPYMVAPGNHDVTCHAIGDIGCPQGQRNFSAYRYRFRMPSVESGAVVPPLPSSMPPVANVVLGEAGVLADSGRENLNLRSEGGRGRSSSSRQGNHRAGPGNHGVVSPAVNAHHNMWYSWNVGAVHFVSLSSETDFTGSPTTPHTILGGGAGGGFGDQIAWLEGDLAKAKADPDVSWIVAIGHRTWYSTITIDWPLLSQKHVQKAFEPILHKYGYEQRRGRERQ